MFYIQQNKQTAVASSVIFLSLSLQAISLFSISEEAKK
jgi:hypothetical protein